MLEEENFSFALNNNPMHTSGFYFPYFNAKVCAVMAHILDGKALGSRIREKIKQRVASLPSQPGLAVILVGDDPASHIYVRLKQEACEEAGIHFELHLFDKNTPQETLLQKVEELNEKKNIHGILVQLPLPSQDASEIIKTIDPIKDVDGFHPDNLEKLRQGKPCIVSAVALGVMRLIREAIGTSPLPSTATIVSSPLFAEPLKLLLEDEKVSVCVTQAEDEDLRTKISPADILIVAEGMPGLITGDMLKPDSIVIDVGTTRTTTGLSGDVDRASAKKVAGYLTPVPGGVGPMTVAMLLVNIVKAYHFQQK